MVSICYTPPNVVTVEAYSLSLQQHKLCSYLAYIPPIMEFKHERQFNTKKSFIPENKLCATLNAFSQLFL